MPPTASIEVLQYERRRQARKTQPDPEGKSWLRRLIWPAALILLAAAAGAAYWINWRLSHVLTVRASVGAALIGISTDIDARLKELYVESGQRVEKGQRLALLDNTEALAIVQAAEATLAMRESAHAHAQAQLTLTQDTVKAGLELAQTRVDASEARLASDQSDLDVRAARVNQQIREAEANFKQAVARAELLRQGPQDEVLQSAREKLEAAKALEALYAFEADQLEELAREGIVARSSFEQKKTQLSTQHNAVHQAQLEIDRLLAGARDQELEIADQDRAARAASLEVARTALDDVKRLSVALKIRQAELREAQAQLQSAQARQAEIALAEENVKSAAADAQRARAEVEARRASAQRMELVSPVSGVVVRTFVNVGELCRKAVPCFQLADESEGQWIDAFVRESDAPLLKVGQTASVEIVIGSGDEIEATVSAIGLATASMDSVEAAAAGSGSGKAHTGSEIVWVRLVPKDPVSFTWLPGMSARAAIRVR